MTKLKKLNETDYSLSGDLSFTTTAKIYKENLAIFEKLQHPLNISLQDVQHVDSSGLALIVEWYRLASKNNQQLTISNIPDQMRDLASLSSIDELFSKRD